MIVKVYRCFMNGVVLDWFANLKLDEVYQSIANNTDEFVLKYKDTEPRMVLQFLVAGSPDDYPISLERVSNQDVELSCSMGFSTSLIGNINSLTDRITSTYDIRFDTKSIISIDNEQMQVIAVSHDYSQNKTYLKVQRLGPRTVHYMGAIIRVIKCSPAMSIYNRSLGMIKVDWSTSDTSHPGNYELEVTVTRGSGENYFKWSVIPIRVRVDPDYNLA